MAQRYNRHVKRLTAFFVILAVLLSFFSLPVAGSPTAQTAETYTYTVDVFKYNATAITMSDISNGGSKPIVFTENTTHSTSNGFKRLTFSSDKDALSVKIAGGDMNSCGAFANGKFNLSKEYNHVYLVGGASSTLANPSNPAVTFYMSATDDGTAKLTTVKNQNQGVQFWFEIGGAARKASGYSSMGGQTPIASTPEFIPYGEVGSNIGTTAGVHVRQTIPENGIASDINPGTDIWFAARTAFAGSATSSTFFGNSTTNTPVTHNALFTMPGEPGPDVTGLNITPGSDESKLCFAWLSSSSEVGALTLWEDGKERETVKFYASAAKLSQKNGYLTNKVTVSGLKINTKYYYTLTHGNLKSKIYTFSTAESADAFSFIMFADAQIGKNGHLVPNEEVGQAWWKTINNVTDKWKDISFMISAGDQVESPNNEDQYDMYLAPRQMRSIPIATTVGSSHDTSSNYLGHFNLPNMSILGSKNSVGTGGDYSFIYGEALFMALNMCSNSSADILEHKQFMKETIDAYIKVNGKEPLWKIVFFHNSVYGAGDHKRTDIARRIRAQLSPVIAELKIDAVFNGHEHAYTRSYMMGGQGNANGGTEAAGTAGSKPIKEGYTADGSNLYAKYTKKNLNETVYFTGNSASLGFSQADSVLDFQYAVKIDKQAQVNGRGGRPSVIKVDVTESELSFNSYYTDVAITEDSLFDSFTLKRERVDIDGLNTLIQTATDKVNNSTYGEKNGDYALAQKTILGNAITLAQAVANKTNRTSSEVDTAASALQSAIDNFNDTLVVVDYEKLNSLIKSSNTIKAAAVEGSSYGQYPAAAITALQSAINNAQKIADNNHLSQQSVNNAYQTLQEAVSEFNAAKITAQYQRGDVNRDGFVGIRDVTLIQKYLVYLETLDAEQLALANVTGSGKVSLKDATKIQKYLARLIPDL